MYFQIYKIFGKSQGMFLRMVDEYPSGRKNTKIVKQRNFFKLLRTKLAKALTLNGHTISCSLVSFVYLARCLASYFINLHPSVINMTYPGGPNCGFMIYDSLNFASRVVLLRNLHVVKKHLYSSRTYLRPCVNQGPHSTSILNNIVIFFY